MLRIAIALAACAVLLPSEPSSMQTIRIVAMGDSTTAGTPAFRSPVEAPPSGKGNEQSQYAYWLMQTHKDWTVLNRGVNGERTDQIAGRFQRDVIDAAPAVVVVIAGVNDIYQGRSVGDVTRRLSEMYARARRAGIRVVAGTIIPFNTATAAQNDKMRQVNAWILEQSQTNPAIVYVDTRAAVAAPGKPDLLASSPDELHPSVDGYRRMAEAIGPAIDAALKR